MKIKLRENTDQNKYDLYRVGNVITSTHQNAYLVVSAYINDEYECNLVDLETDVEVTGRHSTLKDLADEMYAYNDRLMVNPTLVEEGAE